MKDFLDNICLFCKNKVNAFKKIKLTDEMLNLNKKLRELDLLLDKEEYEEIKKEIEDTDKEINERVYRLYGVTEEEKGITESQ